MAAALLGIMIFSSVIFVHVPSLIARPRFESDWTKALVMSAGAFLLAGTLPKARNSCGAARSLDGLATLDGPPAQNTRVLRERQPTET